MKVSRIRLPTTFEEVTSEWLTEALSQRYPGVQVDRVQRSAEFLGTSGIAKLALDYATRGGHDELPDVLYIKGGFEDVMRNRVWEALVQEARFYAELGPEMPVIIPKSYFAGVDEAAKQGVLLLEDLTARNVRFSSNLRPVSGDVMAKILEQQALFHAKWWNSPRLEPYRDWGRPQRLFLKWMFREKSWADIQSRPYWHLVPQVLKSRDFAIRAFERLWEINDLQPQTLQHGDGHGGNLFFESDGRPGFLDWQCAFRGAPGHDVTWAMVCLLEPDTRRANESTLLRHYLAALRAAGVDAPNYDAMFLSYRQNVMHAMSVVANPYNQGGAEVTEAVSIRAVSAAVDLDLIGSLGLRK